MTKIKVGINGAGTVGKRVLEAIAKQDDMEIIGYTKTRPDYTTENLKDYDLYTSFPENFKDSKTRVVGSLDTLMEKCDIIIDATDKRGEEYKEIYERAGIKAIFQGGENSDIGKSFVAQCNYMDSWGKDYVRCVSCNTTGLSRTLNAIDLEYGINCVDAQLIRRGADPKDSKKGPITQIVPVLKDDGSHGHHGFDVKTILNHLPIYTMAVAVPTSMMHMHIVQASIDDLTTKEEVVELLEKTPRVRLIKSTEGFKSTGDIMEYAKFLNDGRRGDMPEVVVWEDSVSVRGNMIRFYQAVHQESIVVPENVDAVRSMFRMMSSEDSIKKTNEAMNL